MAEMDQDSGYGLTVGERLRQAREEQGLTLDDVASRTRIPIRHLRSIEDSNWDDLPAVTYTVGFARNYANAVGLDGAEIGRELREQLGTGSPARQLSPEIYAPPDPARVPSRSLVWIAGIALVVLVVAWLFVIRPWLTRDDDQPAAAAPTEEQAVPAQPEQPQQPASVAGQPVTLVATGDVWLHVNDGASNRRLYYGTLRNGERFQLPSDAAQPLMVLTTNPQNLRVTIGQQDRGPLAPERRRMANQSLRAEDLANLLGQQPAGAAPGPAPVPASGQPQGNGFRPML